MNEDIKSYICSKLHALEKEYNIKIIHAIESGSRAWGFPSKNSDYDVRFIYVRPLDHYLSLERNRDVVETPIIPDDFLGVEFDMNGWDIKKALYLGLHGNAVVNEWLSSPIQYIIETTLHQELLNFVHQTCDLRAYFYFYRNYMREPWGNYSGTVGEEIKIKHYCYVLRCALSLAWLETRKSPPPMDMSSLLMGLSLDEALCHEIKFLIASKAESLESDIIKRNPVLDKFINKAIMVDRERPLKSEQEKQHIDLGNALFRKIVTSN